MDLTGFTIFLCWFRLNCGVVLSFVLPLGYLQRPLSAWFTEGERHDRASDSETAILSW